MWKSVKLVWTLWWCTVALVVEVRAFWDTPHMIVPQIASDSGLISPQSMACVQTVFSQSFYKDYDAFINSGVWADHIKASSPPFGLGWKKGTRAFDEWHFVDYPLLAEGADKCDTLIDQNIVWALERLISADGRDELASEGPMPISPGVALRLITHFLGDLHQPLHCVSRCDATSPDGDRGGNLFYVNNTGYTSAVHNLHSFWDSGAGQYDAVESMSLADKLKELPKLAKIIMDEYPVASKAKESAYGGKADFKTWSESSFDLAKNAYKNLKRDTICSNGKPCAMIPAAYRAEAQKIIRQQLALAGYRLANIIDKHFSNCVEFFPQYGVPTWAFVLCAIIFSVGGVYIGVKFGRKLYVMCLACRSGMTMEYIDNKLKNEEAASFAPLDGHTTSNVVYRPESVAKNYQSPPV